MPFSIQKCVDCSENQLAHSGKCKLKCTCPKTLFSKIHLPGQVLMSVPGFGCPKVVCLDQFNLKYLTTAQQKIKMQISQER